jgi:hypothetical protein
MSMTTKTKKAKATATAAQTTKQFMTSDAYSTIEGAKDAVATRALYELLPNLPLYRGFPPFFRDLW